MNQTNSKARSILRDQNLEAEVLEFNTESAFFLPNLLSVANGQVDFSVAGITALDSRLTLVDFRLIVYFFFFIFLTF